jgi:hypothetical protein
MLAHIARHDQPILRVAFEAAQEGQIGLVLHVEVGRGPEPLHALELLPRMGLLPLHEPLDKLTGTRASASAGTSGRSDGTGTGGRWGGGCASGAWTPIGRRALDRGTAFAPQHAFKHALYSWVYLGMRRVCYYSPLCKRGLV